MMLFTVHPLQIFFYSEAKSHRRDSLLLQTSYRARTLNVPQKIRVNDFYVLSFITHSLFSSEKSM